MRDLEKIRKLKPVISNEPSKWREKADYEQTNKRWLNYSVEVAMIVLNELERQGLNQSDLARIMGVTPQLISRLVKGGENLTFATVAQLEDALKIRFLNFQLKHPDEDTDVGSKPIFSIKSKSDFSYEDTFWAFTMDVIRVYSHGDKVEVKKEVEISPLYKFDFSVQSEELLCYE